MSQWASENTKFDWLELTSHLHFSSVVLIIPIYLTSLKINSSIPVLVAVACCCSGMDDGPLVCAELLEFDT